MDTPVSIAIPHYRGRFAPSPTGPLHFGSLVAALASYVDARAAGGEWLVRIEDVDTARTRAGAERSILAALDRYGFRRDGAILRQSERMDAYVAALHALQAGGLVYACTCSRLDLAHAPIGSIGEPIYPGTCGGRSVDTTQNMRHALRVRVHDVSIHFTDLLQGPQHQLLSRAVGDFVVRRADGLHAYQLAVVVDDAMQQVTTIVRGADLLASTARQIHLQRSLQLATPAYLHVPIAVTATGEKLSKQTLAEALPDDPVPMLLDAWMFLGQLAPGAYPRSTADFWGWATGAWSRDRIPAVLTRPAPHARAAKRAGR